MFATSGALAPLRSAVGLTACVGGDSFLFLNLPPGSAVLPLVKRESSCLLAPPLAGEAGGVGLPTEGSVNLKAKGEILKGDCFNVCMFLS